MNKNPLERQRIEVEHIRENLRIKFRNIFDSQADLVDEINDFIIQVQAWANNGLKFNKDEVIAGLKASLEIKDRRAFVEHLLKILEPLFLLKILEPKNFAKAERESVLRKKENIKLGEFLYIGANNLEDDDERLYLHLTPAYDFITKDKVRDFNLQIKRGLAELAELLKSHPRKMEIRANSWIVAKSPKRLEELGFTIEGIMSNEERNEYSAGETRPVGKAFIKREDFIDRYGSSGKV